MEDGWIMVELGMRIIIAGGIKYSISPSRSPKGLYKL